GTVGPRQFQDDRLWDPAIRALIQKVEVAEDPGFTEAYARFPREHPTRVTVHMKDGEVVVGEAGAPDHDEMGAPKPGSEIERKFLSQAEDLTGAGRAREAVAAMWRVDAMETVREIPPLFVI